MRRRGYLWRFIDLGLIILFGFLMISDITVISQVTLPGKSDESNDPPAEEAITYLGVAIQGNGSYEILNLADKSPMHVGINSAEELEFVLKTVKETEAQLGKVINVLIEPAPDSHMQKLVDVLDVCERLAINKNINTESVFQQPISSNEEEA